MRSSNLFLQAAGSVIALGKRRKTTAAASTCTRANLLHVYQP